MIVNKVDTKLERREKFKFKIPRRKKIDGRMRTLGVIKSVNVLEERNLEISKTGRSFTVRHFSLEEFEESLDNGIIKGTTLAGKRLYNV